MPTLRLALAQLNLTVGDLNGNRRKIVEAIVHATAWRADVVLVPELAITGYPPEDLLLKPSFIEQNLRTLRQLGNATRQVVAVVGYVDRRRAGGLYNSAAVFSHGRLVATYHKQHLPNYGVFDEPRYFTAGRESLVVSLGGVRVGVTICEDLWAEEPSRAAARAGCSLLVNLSASPYHAGKLLQRQALFARRARTHHLAIAHCNLVGGQDELVFDGASLVLDARGRLVAQGAQFKEDLVIADLPLPEAPARRAGQGRAISLGPFPAQKPHYISTRRPRLDRLEEIYTALVTGTRDYVRKNGFQTVVLGLSGGIDSSLVACVAVDALGAERVLGVVMPSRFSATATQDDARALAKALGIRCETLSIEPCFEAFLTTLAPLFGNRPSDAAEQNLQARIRGTLLMALSNKFGYLVLTTGNKSEMATGYCTLYGDMAGGFAVIKDVPKMLVYQLARWRTQPAPRSVSRSETGGARPGPIPSRVFTRAPTAELAPNQTDQDTLPPYEALDRIIHAYVEEDVSVQAILAQNRLDPAMVRRAVRLIDASEYKRRQAPPGVKITPKAFGRDRRMPITNRYREE